MADLEDLKDLDNIDIFNRIAVAIFARLFRSFPVEIHLDMGEIAEEVEVEITPFPGATLIWLCQNGYIVERHFEYSYSNRLILYVLSPKALEALIRVPSSLKASLGKLTAAAATVSSEASKATVTTVVGQIVGSTLRGFIGP